MSISQQAPIHIGILEDDMSLSRLYAAHLEHAGYRCSLFASLAEAKEALARQTFDLLLLDWVLPDGTSEILLQWIREQLGWVIPVLIITSNDKEQTVTHALWLGADDYVIKPPRIPELLARCQALLRRAGHPPSQTNKLERYNPYTIDADNRQIMFHDKPIKLTQKEYALACELFRSRGKLLSRVRLLNTVWGHSYEIDTRTIDTHVSQIRRKLGIVPENGWKIVVEYGYGYRLERITE